MDTEHVSCVFCASFAVYWNSLIFVLCFMYTMLLEESTCIFHAKCWFRWTITRLRTCESCL
jgi:hypothetical protein